MLYYFVIYQHKSNELLYEKNFNVDNKAQMDLFGNFFSAIKSFLLELRISGLQELKTIGLGKLTAFIRGILLGTPGLRTIRSKLPSKIPGV